MAVSKKPAASPLKGKKKQATFVIDCSKPVEDKIMKIGEFEKFLVDKIKVDNKTGISCVWVSFMVILLLACAPDISCVPPAQQVTDESQLRGNTMKMQASLETLCQ